MHDAHVVSWVRESYLSAEILESMRELNHRFLDIVALRPRDWSTSGPDSSAAVSAQVAHLSTAQKAAAASCPYALFDLRFDDDCYWQNRLRAPGCTISRNGPTRFRVNGPTLYGLPAEPRFGSFTRPFSLKQVFWL
jgi:hypothetical protein